MKIVIVYNVDVGHLEIFFFISLCIVPNEHERLKLKGYVCFFVFF